MDHARIAKFRPLHFVKETFTDVSGLKRRFLQLAVLMIVLGAGLQVWARLRGEVPEPWTLSALKGGIGAGLGFLIGAFVRLFALVGLLLAGAAAGAAWALAHFGLIDLPWESYGEIQDGLTSVVDRQTASLRGFLDGILPASMMSGAGLLSGLTQKPGGDDDD